MEEHSKKLLAAEIDKLFFLIRIRSFLSLFSFRFATGKEFHSCKFISRLQERFQKTD